jgi:hypothetical protein
MAPGTRATSSLIRFDFPLLTVYFQPIMRISQP